MKTVLSILCVLGFGWCLWGCEHYQSYSEVPEIHFSDLVFDTVNTDAGRVYMGILTFSFLDGDGDIGVRPQDTIKFGSAGKISKIYYTWYKKMPGGTYETFQFVDGTITAATEIPYSIVMNKDEAQNKVLRGSIRIALFSPTKPEGVDTMRIEYYIVDRARHQSNVDQTPEFSILNPPVPTEVK